MGSPEELLPKAVLNGNEMEMKDLGKTPLFLGHHRELAIPNGQSESFSEHRTWWHFFIRVISHGTVPTAQKETSIRISTSIQQRLETVNQETEWNSNCVSTSSFLN